jgi:hypothetical protein
LLYLFVPRELMDSDTGVIGGLQQILVGRSIYMELPVKRLQWREISITGRFDPGQPIPSAQITRASFAKRAPAVVDSSLRNETELCSPHRRKSHQPRQ